jgi:uncharacterized SAM-binding protein YcdF (DUF218 family)
MLLIALVYALGFIAFVSFLPRAPADLRGADGVVVLTGGETRLHRAVALFEHGVGKRLLISGVDPATTKETLKHLVHGGARFDCCADLGYAAEDTRGNATETADWARSHHFHRLVMVTARYHMPRAIQEFQTAMPDAQLIPYPVEQENVDLDAWWQRSNTLFMLNREYLKFLASFIATSLAKA